MRTSNILLAVATSAAVASCATTPQAPDPVLTGHTQALSVRTDPPGASCSFTQDGKVVASVESTPGTASISRDFRRLFIPVPLEGITPMEVVCRKDGYLDYRASFAVAWAQEVSLEETPRPELSSTEEAGKAVGSAAVAAGSVVLPQAAGTLALAGGAVVAPIALGALVVVLVANKDAPPPAAYAYRALPEFHLTPSTFESEAASDAFFATLKLKLEAARDAQHARIAAECRFWPCTTSDPTPCRDPVCDRRRARADALLKSQLDQIPALRAQVRIVPRSE